jgi:hypothetical protein
MDWQLGGLAPASPTGSPGSMGSSGDATAQLVQAMAAFGVGSGAAESLSPVASTANPLQQGLLTTPQHA